MKEKRQGRSKQPWCEQSPSPGLWATLGRYFESYAIVCYLSFSSWNSEWRILRHRCYPQLLPSAHLGFPCLPPPQMSTSFPAPVPASQIWWSVCPVLLLLSPLYLPPAREWIQIHRGDLASDTFWEGSKSKHSPVSCFPCHRKVYMRGCRRERSKVKGWPNLADCLWTPQEKRWQNLKPLFSGDCCRWEDWNWGPIGWLPKEGVSGHERCQPSAQIVA